MKKLIVFTMMLMAFASFSNAQCPSPSYQWKGNKNAFVIQGVPFTSDSVTVRWQIGNTTSWGSKTGKLHALSTVFCPNANNCTYSLYFVNVLYPSQIGYGLINGGQVQFSIKCNGIWIDSSIETVGNLK